jgi:chemosensory pili system protein ChpA (sensor histidine kinase/response regulator)
MDTYAGPMLSLEAVDRLKEGEMLAYLGGEAVQHEYGKHSYPLHSLGIMFGDEVVINEGSRSSALLFRSAEASAALQVDEIVGHQEIIVKPVGPQLHNVPGISGATVLGDGRVVVVLELAALVRKLTSQAQQQMEAQVLRSARQEPEQASISAMVIDDSITMRKVTARFLGRHSIDVRVAKDGIEAVAMLEEQVPDFAILDIEMPRMDGFEVVAHVRNQPHLKNLPIIMVTSRSGEKHRTRAARLGVNDYLIKPYQEEEMMASIQKVLNDRGLDFPI